MFSLVFDCLFVSRIMQKTNQPVFFHKIWWKGGTWATEETSDFDGNVDQVALGLSLGGPEQYSLSLSVLMAIFHVNLG